MDNQQKNTVNTEGSGAQAPAYKIKTNYFGNKPAKQVILDYIRLLFIGLIFGVSYQLFVKPNNFSPAGMNGIAMMFEHLWGFSMGYFAMLVNIPLCIFAWILVDKEFALKTFFFCIVTSVIYLLVGNEVINLSKFVYKAETDTILPALLGGAVSGFGYGLTFKDNASTGGVDIFAKYISKKKPLLNFFWVTLAINAVVCAVSYFVYAYDPATGAYTPDFKPVALCLVYCFTSSYVGNIIIKGMQMGVKFTVITSHADEIQKEIVKELHHGATRMKAVGVYSGEEKDILICVVNKHQVEDFKTILKKYPDTFTTLETVTETVGRFRNKEEIDHINREHKLGINHDDKPYEGNEQYVKDHMNAVYADNERKNKQTNK